MHLYYLIYIIIRIMEIKGKLIEIFDEVQISDRFRKREFVIEYADNPQFPEYIKLECIQDKCSMLDNFRLGQDVNVSINLKGRKWTDPRGEVKYFNTIQAWRIEAADNMPAQEASTTQNNVQHKPAPDHKENDGLFTAEEDDDDLPF